MIQYHSGNDLDIEAMIDLYVDSTLGERRPVSDRERMAGMLRHANLVITAWDDDVLVGIARSVSDFHYATYLSDIAVRLSGGFYNTNYDPVSAENEVFLNLYKDRDWWISRIAVTYSF